MTIHKAKGLGFPVVIVLLYGTSSHGFDYIIDREGEEVVLLKLNKKIAEAAPEFKARYDEEVLKEMVNRLNSLYVGFTRAKEELYVIGVRGKRDFRPLDLLPVGECPPVAKSPRILEERPDIERISPMHHPTEPLQFHTGSEGQGRLSSGERRRGELIHGVLSLIEYAGEDVEGCLTPAVQRLSCEMGEEHDPREIRRIVLEIIEHPEIRELFILKPGREIRREQEVVDGEGRLFRMDRLIIDQDRVTVIDWKTGKETGEHRAQMKNYLGILEGIYPGKAVEGLLAYVDLKEVRRFP
jgi:ATP-dependent exoDNAse (exonuclease V) beta subunit